MCFAYLRRTGVLAAPAMALWIAAGYSAPAQAGPLLDKVRSSKTLTIGYRPEYPPFSYTMTGGQVTGFGVEVCQQIAQQLEHKWGIKLQLRYLPVSSKQRIPAVQDGTIDLECADTTNTKERRDKFGVAFLSPYFVTGVRVLSHTRSGVAQPEALRGKTVIYPADTTAEIIAQKYQPLWQFKPRICGPQFADCMKELENGTADHWLMDDIALQTGRATSTKPNSYRSIGKLLSIDHLAVMYKGGDREWTTQLNAAMNHIMTSGEGRKLYRKWFEQPIPPQNINMNLRPSPLLLRYMNRPSPNVGEFVVY